MINFHLHLIPCLDVLRMTRATWTIRKRIQVQRKASDTQTELALIPPQAT